MYFNRKNAEQKNWRMIKKGKHFLSERRQTSFLAFVFFSFQKYVVSSSDIPFKNRI